jgi:hypothetical protein
VGGGGGESRSGVAAERRRYSQSFAALFRVAATTRNFGSQRDSISQPRVVHPPQ